MIASYSFSKRAAALRAALRLTARALAELETAAPAARFVYK